MNIVYIFAYPMQAFTIQVFNRVCDELSPLENANCLYSDIVPTINHFKTIYAPQEYYITGVPDFYNHIKKQIEQALEIEIKEVEND